jgi:hypothetical protein
MQDVGRYLLFSGAQADGLPAQLHALRLGVAACAEATREPANGQLWQGLIAEHSQLLAKANLSNQAAEARCGELNSTAPSSPTTAAHQSYIVASLPRG